MTASKILAISTALALGAAFATTPVKEGTAPAPAAKPAAAPATPAAAPAKAAPAAPAATPAAGPGDPVEIIRKKDAELQKLLRDKEASKKTDRIKVLINGIFDF